MAHGTVDDARNAGLRNETPEQRADRNYGELLQELRVVQTGVQILFAFLLSLAFYERFREVTTLQRNLYLVTLLLAVTASGLLMAPVAHHRLLFRQHQKEELVEASNRLALAGLSTVMLALTGAVGLILDVLLGHGAAVVGSLAVIGFLFLVWFVMPRYYRQQDNDDA